MGIREVFNICQVVLISECGKGITKSVDTRQNYVNNRMFEGYDGKHIR